MPNSPSVVRIEFTPEFKRNLRALSNIATYVRMLSLLSNNFKQAISWETRSPEQDTPYSRYA